MIYHILSFFSSIDTHIFARLSFIICYSLIGERVGKPGSWQTPQGGVDGGETVREAAKRELYEEVGLQYGKHVLLESIDDKVQSAIKCQYKTEGTGSWLEKAGFVGQELNFVFFRCASSELEKDPSKVCNLEGLNGEKAEFTQVRWEKLDWVVKNVWEKKSLPYKVLKEAAGPILKEWDEKCQKLGFGGKWERDNKRNDNVAESLIARASLPAVQTASQPYVQQWKQDTAKPKEWKVTTYDNQTGKPRREITYYMGDWVEKYEGDSTLFGAGGCVKRCCFYLAEDDADDKIAHVTVTDTKRGTEESLRYIKNDELILRRTFTNSRLDKFISTEVFTRC